MGCFDSSGNLHHCTANSRTPVKLIPEYLKDVRYKLTEFYENQGCSLKNQYATKNYDLTFESMGKLQSNPTSPQPRTHNLKPIEQKHVETMCDYLIKFYLNRMNNFRINWSGIDVNSPIMEVYGRGCRFVSFSLSIPRTPKFSTNFDAHA